MVLAVFLYCCGASVAAWILGAISGTRARDKADANDCDAQVYCLDERRCGAGGGIYLNFCKTKLFQRRLGLRFTHTPVLGCPKSPLKQHLGCLRLRGRRRRQQWGRELRGDRPAVAGQPRVRRRLWHTHSAEGLRAAQRAGSFCFCLFLNCFVTHQSHPYPTRTQPVPEWICIQKVTDSAVACYILHSILYQTLKIRCPRLKIQKTCNLGRPFSKDTPPNNTQLLK